MNAGKYNTLQNIENLTRIRSKTKNKGVSLSYLNKVLPFSFAYTDQNTDQKMLDVVRSFSMDQKIYQATTNKSFGQNDHHVFSYVRTESSTLQTDEVLPLPLRTINSVDFYELGNDFSFDKNRKYTYSSALSHSNEHGTTNYTSYAAQENLTLHLPCRFVLSNNYNYRKATQDLVNINYQRIGSQLGHQLFESLSTSILYEHSYSDQTSYVEKRDKGGLELRYVKNIPTGKLMLTYYYYKERQVVKNPSFTTEVRREEYTLRDNEITFLRNQNVDINSIVVKDVTSSTIYQLGRDYILIDRKPFIEIVRVPGGLIPNNGTVYLYYFMQTPTGDFTMNSNSFFVDLWLYKNVLNIYYRLFTQGYSNRSGVENQVLNTLTRYMAGVRFDFSVIKGGAEYEYSISNVMPYKGMKYFIYYQKMFSKMNLTLNANYQDYKMNNETSSRRDMDVSGKVVYSVLDNIKFNAEYMYRLMSGRGIDMKVHTAKVEITTALHSLYLTIGGDIYWNESLNSRTNYKGAYVQLTRNF